MTNPTIQRRRLGHALKRAREAAGRTQDEAATQIDAAASKISRLELGQSGIKVTDLTVLLRFYGVRDDESDSLRELARSGRQRGRWSGHRTVIPDWFRQYVDLEDDASEIRWYQPEIVPGILQIEPYIRALNSHSGNKANVDDQTQVRLERQAIIDRADAPELSLVLSESALRRRIGTPETMRDQLAHLAKTCQRSNVELQVLPFDAGPVGAAWAGFTLLRYGHDPASDVVYLEDYTDATYLDRPDAVRAYNKLWSRLQAAALGPGPSQRLIERLAEEVH